MPSAVEHRARRRLNGESLPELPPPLQVIRPESLPYCFEVVRLCGYLPLAIRIAGACLAARPGRTVGVLATELADATRRLEELQAGEFGGAGEL